MAMDPQPVPEIAEITRHYGGLEGRRVKAGTRFAVGKSIEGLPVITQSRYIQLSQAKLARPWTASPQKAATVTPTYAGAGQVVKQPIQTASRSVAKAKARVQPREAPEEPRPLVNPAAGGQTGQAASASLSPEDQASQKATFGLRGTRRASRPLSTTPGSSLPGPTPSTPATAPGGASTKAPKGSKG